VYGKITASAIITATIARWSYTVTTYVAGVAGASVTAYNLLEKENTATSAYGYTVTSGTLRIASTNYYVRPVPDTPNTWVRMELTNNVDGVSKYWFSAPNIISGTC
jgi:type I restriction-modification system DNA methylase subunit